MSKLTLELADDQEARAVIIALSTYGRVIANTDSQAQAVERCDRVRQRLEKQVDEQTGSDGNGG